MKKIILLVVIVAMFGWAIYDLIQPGEEKNEETKQDQEDGFMISSEPNDEEVQSNSDVGLEIGSEAPDFELETLDGETVKLSDYRGKRVMINFWATWCPPCRAEMPDMQKFYEEKDVVILAVNLFETESSIQDVHDFKEDFELSFQIPIDKKGDVSTEYQILPIPTSYFVDSNGIIQHKSMGAMNYEMMVKEFEKME
ncbi:redoxin domain-containing protein [Filobacillus milosensis]|uniref:Redoxin domain-containing protein n=1 Tax=Filobacillus milosensis TaxID=94137 RepID=A0A4Y8INI6_9BACI|nr:redoxin domain-containing protein [Filobacillus milosensis]TFB23115.1 redoxin domain-containing protein [Filobacillus milosensis]